MTAEPHPIPVPEPAPPLVLALARAHLEVPNADAALTALAAALVADGAVAEGFPAALLEREHAYPTGLPTPIPTAIPHADPEHVLRPGLVIATLARPVTFREMGSREGTVAVRLVAMPLLTDAREHLAALQRLMGLLGDQEAVQELLEAADDQALRACAESRLGGSAGGAA